MSNNTESHKSNSKSNPEPTKLSPEVTKELGAAIPPAAGNQGALKPTGNPPEPTPETAASSSSHNKRSADLLAAIPATVPREGGFIRLESAFAEDLSRMENLIFRRTNLEASTERMVRAIIAEAHVIFDDIFSSYHFISANPRALKQRFELADGKLAELRAIDTRGKVTKKFLLTAEEMSKLCMYAQVFSSYFAETYTPRSALKFLWLRGGILIAENLSKPQS
jgi:hypothetical protein